MGFSNVETHRTGHEAFNQRDFQAMTKQYPRRATRTVPRHRQEFAVSLCEMWHFDPGGRVVGGDLYYDQVSLLTQLGLMPQPAEA